MTTHCPIHSSIIGGLPTMAGSRMVYRDYLARTISKQPQCRVMSRVVASLECGGSTPLWMRDLAHQRTHPNPKLRPAAGLQRPVHRRKPGNAANEPLQGRRIRKKPLPSERWFAYY